MSYIGKQPIRTALTSSDIEDGVITAAKIEDGAVVAAEIASNAVTTAKINADAVTSAKIADNAVVTAAINADAVTGAKIADDAINSEHYTDGSIDTAHIADANITSAKLSYPLTTFSSTGIDDNATSTAVTIDSSENIGIGTTSPAGLGSNITTLEITGGSTARTGGLYLSNSDKSIKGYFYGSNTGYSIGTESNSNLGIITNNTERVRIHSDGVMSAANGIALGVGTADTASNVLDDYEEGTFTPGTNIGFSSVVGEYVKIGKMVHFAIQGTFNAGPGDGSQASSITGLPFSASPGDQLCEIWVVTHDEHVIGQVGGTSIGLKGRGDGVNITRGQIGSKGFQATGTYHIDL